MTRFSATPSGPPTPPAAWRPTAVALRPGRWLAAGTRINSRTAACTHRPPTLRSTSPPPLPLARAAPRSESGPPPPPQPERPLDRGRAERGWGGHRGDPEAPPLPTRIADSDIRRAAAGVAFGGGPGAVLRDVGRDAARPGPLLLFIYFLYLLSLLLYNDDVMIKNNNDK